MRPTTAIAAAAVALPLALPAVAGAHVTLQPKEVAAGSYVVMDVRVPNEQDDANTTKVDVQLPPGFAEASYQATPGWRVKVTKTTSATPLQTDDGPVTEQVSRITWTGSGSGDGVIAPGQFRDFPLSVEVPGKAGDTLTFKALQTYSNGDVVRWIGAEGSDTPAPTVEVTAAAAADGASANEPTAGPAAAAAPAPAAATDDGGTDTLSVIALVVGALGLLVGGVALARGRG